MLDRLAEAPLSWPAELADKLVVLAVCANPEPMNAIRDRDTERAVVKTNADALEATIGHGLERQRRMRWISLQLGKGFVCQRLHFDGQSIERLPVPL